MRPVANSKRLVRSSCIWVGALLALAVGKLLGQFEFLSAGALI